MTSEKVETVLITEEYKSTDSTLFGDYIPIPKDVCNETEIDAAKKTLVSQIHGVIDALAESIEDFFIVKEDGNGNVTVGWKIAIPNRKDLN